MAKCELCEKQEDERNIQEQANFQLCNSCNCIYSDEELINLMEEK